MNQDATEKFRLFVDIDGTLAVFKNVDCLERLYEKGYFENLTPIPSTIQAVKKVMDAEPEIEVYILSAVLSDSPYAEEEKNRWLDKYLPEIPPERRIFPPCGTDKKEYIPEKIRGTDYLLDDYTHNLTLWQPPGKGIKLLNGINHTHGTWQHDTIWYKKDAEVIANNVINIIENGQIIKDRNRDLLYGTGNKQYVNSLPSQEQEKMLGLSPRL